MILAATISPHVISLVVIGFIITVLGFLLKRFKQPVIVSYIIAGMLMGPKGLGLVKDAYVVDILGELGLILLLFFIGMEISLPKLFKRWKIATFGVVLQVLASVLIVGIIGYFFQWPLQRIIVLGFILSLSSSAVVIKLLQDNQEIDTVIGQNVLGILLMQDILIVPMLLITEFLSGKTLNTHEIILQIVGGLLIIALVFYILRKKEIKLPFSKRIEKDYESQVFIALLFSLGFAIVTSYLGLSAALGAFFGGIFISATDSGKWFHDSLSAFRVAFVSMFFVSIGMLIDLEFLVENWKIVAILMLSAYFTNHLINTLVLNFFCKNKKNSIYGGALLGQVGELGFIILGTAYYYKVISDYAYQLVVLVVSLSLLISPFWIGVTKRLTFRGKPVDGEDKTKSAE